MGPKNGLSQLHRQRLTLFNSFQTANCRGGIRTHDFRLMRPAGTARLPYPATFCLLFAPLTDSVPIVVSFGPCHSIVLHQMRDLVLLQPTGSPVTLAGRPIVHTTDLFVLSLFSADVGHDKISFVSQRPTQTLVFQFFAMTVTRLSWLAPHFALSFLQ